jgi:putative tryptophan/tyrosine transport system ATP-binding protein
LQNNNRKPLIRMENIHMNFNPGTVNEIAVFEHFDFSVDRGEFVSVVGSNGSGKTTMLNLICGSFPMSSGRIFLDEKDITAMPEYKRAARIGRVFQNPAKGTCPQLTIMENMSLAENKGRTFGLGKGVNRRQADYYRSRLELLGLGLEDKLDILVGSLSGGQRQALALLIATMTPIDLLVLDEHTAALDPKSSQTVMDLTLRVIREKQLTALMVTHNLRFAVEYGNRLVMMHEGKTVIDTKGRDKSEYTIESLLKTFNEISVECGN